MSEYSEKFKSPKWQKLRLKVLERDDFICQSCYTDDKTLHVHHKQYLLGKEPWEYDMDYLVTLCADCHSFETDHLKKECEALISAAKIRLLSASINELACALYSIVGEYPPEVLSSVAARFFSNRSFSKQVCELYFKDIAKREIRPMADVQPDQFTKIANELLEAICRINLTSYESRVFMAIMRLTYGWNKKAGDVSITSISEITNLKRRHVSRSISLLTKRNMILRNGITGIQKDYERWVSPNRVIAKVSPNEVIGVSPNEVTILSPNEVTPLLLKERKETLKKEREHFFGLLWDKYPEKVGEMSAMRHFLNTVKTKEHWEDINKALKNYLESPRVKRGYIQNGSTWFNGWRDWVNYVSPVEKTMEVL